MYNDIYHIEKEYNKDTKQGFRFRSFPWLYSVGIILFVEAGPHTVKDVSRKISKFDPREHLKADLLGKSHLRVPAVH